MGNSPDGLLGRVDAAVVMTRDAATHRALAGPLLRSGVPVFVDKPFAPTVPDALAILAAARFGGVRTTSFSALRFQPAVRDLAASRAGRPQRVSVVGPTDPACRHGGRLFYAPHAVEMALQLAPGPVTGLTARAASDGVIVTFTTCCPVEVRLGPPDAGFAATVSTVDDIRCVPVGLGPEYFEPAAERIVGFLTGGASPVSERGVLDAVRVLAVVAALDRAPR